MCRIFLEHLVLLFLLQSAYEYKQCEPFVLPSTYSQSTTVSLYVSSSASTSKTTTRPFNLATPNQRLTLAIISHPDSGKTTMTEKLLLHSGSITTAGAVRGKDQKSTSSDFMDIEKERGISICATVMSVEYLDKVINVIDTPGHMDFSEDTYRALAASDNALMLVDAGKGLEPQTLKLFEVCKLRGLPVFTFCNKMDRPSLEPMEIMDEIEKRLGIETWPVVWPIGNGDSFIGVVDRITDLVYIYDKSDKKGQISKERIFPSSDTTLLKATINDSTLYDKLMQDLELLKGMLPPLDKKRILSGDQSILFFGSALTDFGVGRLLDYFVKFGALPGGRKAVVDNGFIIGIDGCDADEKRPPSRLSSTKATTTIPSTHPSFTSFIFKTQANLDPNHRDRLAFLRIISGTYTKGLKVKHSRSNNSKVYTLSSAQSLLGRKRSSIEIGFPGDVIGINNPNGLFAIGDTLSSQGGISFEPLPMFAVEKFAVIRNGDSGTYKSFGKGLSQLIEEGAIQLLRERGSFADEGGKKIQISGAGSVILAAVGSLQFDVVLHRLKGEYGCVATLETLPFLNARWALGGWDCVDQVEKKGNLMNVKVCEDRFGRPVLLFRNEWKAEILEREEKALELQGWCLPPLI